MAETTYKKGELLFEGNTTTTDTGSGFYVGSFQIQTLMSAEETVIINFDETEYTCEKITLPGNNTGWMYGGFTSQGRPVFTDYPFAFAIGEYEGTPVGNLFTENPGTYNLKIYTAIPNSDSSSEPITIRSYITKNLSSLNWNILPQIFAENGVEMNEEIEAYLRNTPENTNWSILEQLGENTAQEQILFEGNKTAVQKAQAGWSAAFSREELSNIVIDNEDIVTVILSNNTEIKMTMIRYYDELGVYYMGNTTQDEIEYSFSDDRKYEGANGALFNSNNDTTGFTVIKILVESN